MSKKIFPLILGALTLILFFSCGERNSDSSEDNDQKDRNDGAYQLPIELSGSLQNPAFSPDGKSILFTRFRDGYNSGASDLYIFNRETGELRALVSDGNGNVNLPGSSWNAVNNSIVFSSERDPHDEIFLIAASGKTGDERRITYRENRQAYEPTFSPDGTWIVFESHRIDVENDGIIIKFKIDGSSGYIELTASGKDCKQPNWSPAGDRILYQIRENGTWSIRVMDINGNGDIRVTGAGESATDASFSNDGQWIVYSSENSDVSLANLYRIPSTGGTAERITNSNSYDGAPSVSPDGTMVAFESSPGDPEESKGTTLWIISI